MVEILSPCPCTKASMIAASIMRRHSGARARAQRRWKKKQPAGHEGATATATTGPGPARGVACGSSTSMEAAAAASRGGSGSGRTRGRSRGISSRGPCPTRARAGTWGARPLLAPTVPQHHTPSGGRTGDVRRPSSVSPAARAKARKGRRKAGGPPARAREKPR